MIFQSCITKTIKKNIRNIFLIFFILSPLFANQNLLAATLYSRQSGAWNDRNTWTQSSTHSGNRASVPGNNDIVVIAAGHVVSVTGSSSCDILYIGTDGTSISQPHNNINSGTVTISRTLTAKGIEYVGTNNLIEISKETNQAPELNARYLCRAPGHDDASITYSHVARTQGFGGRAEFSAYPPYQNRATFDNPNGVTDCECGVIMLTDKTNTISINANKPKFYSLVTNSSTDATFDSNDTIIVRGVLQLYNGQAASKTNVFDIGNNTLLFINSELNETIDPPAHPLKFDSTYSIKIANEGRVIYKRTSAFTYQHNTTKRAPVFFFPITVGTKFICGIVNFSNGDQFEANSTVEFSPRIKTLVFDEPVINSEDFYIDFRIDSVNFTGTAIPGNDKFASIDIYTHHAPNAAEPPLRELLYEIFDVDSTIQRIGECVHEDYESKKTGAILKQSFKIVDMGARPIYKHLALLIVHRFYSVKSGNWNGDVWTPLKTHEPLTTSQASIAPTKDSKVVIAKNHNIEINTVAQCGYLYVGSDNDVVSIPGETSNDKKGTLNVTTGGTLTVGEFIADTGGSKLNIMNNAILNVNNAAQVTVKGNSLFDGIGASINISDNNTGFINEGIFKYKHDDTPNPTHHSINISNGNVHFYKGIMREQGVVNDGASLAFTQSAGTVSIYECDPLDNRSEFDAPNGIFNVTGGEIVFESVRTGNTGNNILAIDVPNNTTFYKLTSRVDNVDASKASMNLTLLNSLQLATTVSGNNIFNIASNTLTFDGGDAVNFGEEFIYVSNPTSASLDEFSVSRSILKTPDGHVIYTYTNDITPIAFNQDKKFLFPISMGDRFFGSSINLKGNSTEFLSSSNTTIEILPFPNSPHYQIPIESGVNAYWKTDLQGVVTLGAPDLELFLEPNEITTGKIHRIDDPINAIAYRLYSLTNTAEVINGTLQARATEISNQPSPLWEWVPAGTNSSENYWSILSLKLTFYSLTDGLWSDPNSWTYLKTHSGIPMAYPPTAEDEVIISAGHTISVESDAVCAYLFVGSDNTISVPHNSVLSGQLLFPSTGSGNLVVGELKRDVETTKVKIQKESLLDISGENSKMKVYGKGVTDNGFYIIGNSTLSVRNLGSLDLEQIELEVGAATCNVEGATSSQFSKINLRGTLNLMGISSIVNITDSAHVMVQPYENKGGGIVNLTGGNLNVSEKGLLEVEKNLNISAGGILTAIDTGKVKVNTYISLNGSNAGANLIVKNRANVMALDSIVYTKGNNAKITLEHTDNDDAHTTLITTYALRRGLTAGDDNITMEYKQVGGELCIQNVSGNPISVPTNRANLDIPNATFSMSNTVHSPASPSIPFSQINGNIRFVGGANASEYSMYLPSEAEVVKLIVSESSVLSNSNFKVKEALVLLDKGRLDIFDKTLTLLGGDHNKVYGASWADNLEAFSKDNSIYLYEQGGGKVIYSYPAGTPQTIHTEFMFPISRIATDSIYMGSSLILPDNGYTTFGLNATIGLMPYPTAPAYTTPPSKFFNGYWKSSLNDVVVDANAALTPIEFHYNQYSGTIETMPLMRVEDVTTNPVLFSVFYETLTTTEPVPGYFKNVTELNPPTTASGWNWQGDNYWTFAVTYYSSIRSGRWSDPMTWDVGSVPSSTDEVELKHIVYTGLYDNTTNILGSRQWAEAEEDISGADLTVPGVAKLCKKLTILGDGDNNGGLLIGNNAPAPTNGERRVLSFGEVHNNSLGDENLEMNFNIDSFKVAATSLDILIPRMKGIYIMEDGGIGSASLFKPQMQVLKIESKGSIFNSSILEIGAY